jgi:chlorobactene glucosyltransferase
VNAWPWIAALPWLLHPIATVLRVRRSRSLDEFPPSGSVPQRVSIVIPARDEAANISRCLGSVLGSNYPDLEVIVIDDRSTDDTAAIARATAAGDERLRVVDGAPLPDGWFGKQWACTQGARIATGTMLCFTDADTVHSPDLVPRAVAALEERHADLLTVAGRQELGSLAERMVQPQVFSLLAARYGGTEEMNRSPRPLDKIANGQFMLFTRPAYEKLGGHASVRDKVAEDLALAQRCASLGMRLVVVLGLQQLSTRMYTSLGSLVRGWMKNIYAGGIDAVPFCRLGRAFMPIALILAPLWQLVPVTLLILGAFGVLPLGVVLWSSIVTALLVAWWAIVYRFGCELSPVYALLFPAGATILLFIILRALSRGRSVEWKGRRYRSA